ncbi:MAG: amidohydrolase family protein [bacterium]
MSLLFTNATLVNLEPAAVTPHAQLRCREGRIAGLGRELAAEPGEEVVDLGGALLMPGLVVGHHHLYSALARGMPFSGEPPKDFHDTLKKIWWKVDSALDEETNYCSALAGALDAVRFGVTGIIDHHASPGAVDGSLDAIARGLEEVGLRGLLCYEVSDRDGADVARAGIAENRRFQAARVQDPLLRGMIGAHASFTIGDDTLDRLAELCHDSGAGIHIHLLEDAVDRSLSLERYGADPVRRLADRELLQENAILSHGVHLTPDEVLKLREARVLFAHNARSNMNNRVGAAAVSTFGERVVLGTDGIDGDILAEARCAMFRGREHRPPVDMGQVVSMLRGSGKALEEYFGCAVGELAVGAAADLTVLDYDPPTPLTSDNLIGHLAFGWGAHLVRSVIVAGRFVYRNRQFTTVDAAALAERTRAAATALWRKLGQ